MIPRTRDALARLLERTFPHSPDVSPAAVDAFVDGLMRIRTEARSAGGGAPASGGEHRLFRLRATHARRTPITSVFTGVTHVVRVRLPADEPRVIATALGEVLPEDHLLPSVKAVAERFGSRLGRSFARVDLITSARSTSVRFAPMALYFGYLGEDDLAPSFVVYEPGDALGRPGAVYLGETLASVVEEPAGYKPTPLSSPEHWYTGGLRMSASGRDPEVLHMHAAVERGGEPHFRLHVDYEAIDADELDGSGIGDLVEAATRMLAVQHGVGVEQGLVERIVAELGLASFAWVDRPDNAEEGPLREQAFVVTDAFEPWLAARPAGERALLEASPARLLGAVVRADRRLDRLERIELDWTMNFAVPRALGESFRFSAAAAEAYASVLAGTATITGPAFEGWLAELGHAVAAMPAELRERYTACVVECCRDAAEASGGWLWFGSKVGDEEKLVLDQIATALGVEPPSAA